MTTARTSEVDVLVVLAHPILVRNFVTDGSLQAVVARGLRTAVIAPAATLPMIRELVPGLASLHALDPVRPTRRRIQTLQWLRLGSFFARRQHDAYALKIGYARKVKLTSRLVIAAWERLAHRGDPEATAARWAARLRPNQGAMRMMSEIDPALVLWPTTISDPADFEVVQAAVRQQRRLVMCEGSWDNLVTKGAIWPRPERLLVWGQFSRRQALNEHGFNPAEVVVTGPPHFGVYADPSRLTPRAEWFARHSLDPNRRLIFVAGSTIGYKVEPLLLRELSAAVNRGDLPPAYIWYRAHPKVGTRFDRAQSADDPNIRIDPSVDEGDASVGMARIIHAAEARQRADALAASDAIVSMFSTVVLEGALLGKPVALVDPKGLEGVSGRPTTSYERMAHLRHILACPLIRLVPTLAEIPDTLKWFFSLDAAETATTLRAFADDVMSCGPEMPATRLAAELERLLDRSNQRRAQTLAAAAK